MNPTLEQQVDQFIRRHFPFREGYTKPDGINVVHATRAGINHRLAFVCPTLNQVVIEYEWGGLEFASNPGPLNIRQNDDVAMRRPDLDDEGTLALLLMQVNARPATERSEGGGMR